MTDTSLTDQVDRLSRRRARVLPLLGILLITQQASFINTVEQHGDALRAVDGIRLSAWVLTVLVMLAVLMTGGSWFRRREVRALLNDEVTRANRRSALATGFVVSMATGVVCYILAGLEVIDARVAIHVIVSTGLAAALMRFGELERRAHRDV